MTRPTTTHRPAREPRRALRTAATAAVLAAAAALTTACAASTYRTPGDETTTTPSAAPESTVARTSGPQVPQSTAPQTTPVQESPRSAVPGFLVGTWDGGNEPQEADISFSPDGEVRLSFSGGSVLDGTVVVERSTMTFYWTGQGREALRWFVVRGLPTVRGYV